MNASMVGSVRVTDYTSLYSEILNVASNLQEGYAGSSSLQWYRGMNVLASLTVFLLNCAE